MNFLILVSLNSVNIESFLGSILLFILIIYLIVFIILSLIRGDIYLASSPIQKKHLTSDIEKDETIEKEYEENYREQNFSAILAGFAISVLAFIFSIDKIKLPQQTIEFFFIGLFLEVLSFLCFKYMVRRAYNYYGTLFQYSGLLSILNGFFIFIIHNYQMSTTIIITFIFGYIGFLLLTIKLLYPYIQEMKKTKQY
jgi:hypothetical protein